MAAGRCRRVAFAAVATGCALSGVYARWPKSSAGSVSLLVVAVGSCTLLVLGPKLHRPRQPWPFRLIAGAAMTFLAGMVVRPWAAGQHGPAMLSADVFTLSGYLMLILGFALMLRARGRMERHALTDGVIICLGAALLATVLFALPATDFDTRPLIVDVLAAVYPMLDIVLLLLLLNLGFSTAIRLVSFQLIAGAMFAMMIGDIGYAWIGAQGQLSGSPLLDLPFLWGYTLMGAGAIHPSMAGMSSIVARPVQPWSLPRLAVIVPALLSPLVLLILPEPALGDRIAVALASSGVACALLFRALSAVRGYARAQRALRDRVTRDSLTGLANRAALIEHLQKVLGTDRDAVWMLFVDLDGFKLVNDHWGHETGDRLLVQVAGRLRALSGGAYLVTRIGGDEFAIVGHGPQSPCLVAGQIQEALRDPVDLAGMELVLTTSIGIVSVQEQTTPEAMLRDADTAMYRAKADGRDRWVVFDRSMRESVRRRVETEVSLRHALAEGELWVAYQPLMDARTLTVAGAEALVRWTHPERGLIFPGDFIPVAEETGLIAEIGSWVLDESLRQVAEWAAMGVLPDAFSVSVNASARQITDRGLRQLIGEAMQRHGLPPSRLTLEITESVMMTDPQAVAIVLAELRQMGLHLSVDDFGTGYSSLGYLSRFPVTEVKIDRAFVSGLGQDPGDEAIVRAIVAMASALGLSVVAEGVETEQQRDAIRALGVDRAQGWLWGKAIPGEEFAEQHLTSVPVQAGVGNSKAQ